MKHIDARKRLGKVVLLRAENPAGPSTAELRTQVYIGVVSHQLGT